LEWLEIAPGLVVNRPSDMESNGSKPYQAQLIAECGFEVPETLVTSDPDEARAFWKQYERVVFKSISGVRSIVTELDEAHAGRLDQLRSLPAQFQAYVPGEDVRVHVVGDATFACVIESGAMDYRYAQRQGCEARLSPLELPRRVSSRCVALARRLHLPFCGIDLRRTPDGRWVCFEVNPMPAYTYFENESGLPISRALINLLSNGLEQVERHGPGD
jgi:glutathione synthase/RimK-type ligase-like ATP-grasp enzyme